MRRALLLIPVALLIVLGGFVLFPGRSRDEPPDFAFINRGDIKTLDPNRMSWAQDIRIGYALWEGLYRLDPATLDPELGAAERVDLSDDKTVYTFHIRPDARWSNGDPLEAKDFVFAWRRMLEEPDEYSYLLFYMKGARAYSEAFARDTAVGKTFDQAVGIEVLGPRTLRVRLEHPVTFFPDLCAFPPYFPLHEPSMLPFKSVDSKSGRVSYSGKFTRPPHLVTNGPFRLHDWKFKGRLRMMANDHYWDRANVKSRIIDQVYGEGQVAFEMYDRGEVDWHLGIEVMPEISANLKAAGRTDLHVWPGFGTYFYSFNCLPKLPDGRKNPFADVRVRQALSMAVDKRPIVETVTRMGEPVTANYVPPGAFPKYPQPQGLPHDPQRARRLMAEAGYPGGAGFPAVSLLFNNDAHHGDVAQIVRRQWQKELGVNVTLEGVEIKIFGDRLHNQEYAVARASWIGDYNDPSTFTDKYLSFSEQNDSKWVSAEYDRLCAQAAVESDVTRRLALLSRAEAILLAEAPILPMYSYVNVDLHRDNVVGTNKHPKNMVAWKEIGRRKPGAVTPAGSTAAAGG
jgi:oligopeptide transport system substrate-binding protein